MTRLNFTFQEASPLITYSGWVEGSSSNDTFSESYNGSFRVTFTAGATAAFHFSGTAVSIFGATRPNHGNYTVNFDTGPQFSANGASTDTFNKSLWHADNLVYKQHAVKLTNVPSSSGVFLDVDYVSIERQIGSNGDTVFQTTIDDADTSSVHYIGSWQETTGILSAHQGTLHTTNEGSSQVVVAFRGCCVELYGQYANAKYTVIVDSQPAVSMQGMDIDLAPNFQHPQTLLYLVDGLSEGNHTVTLNNSDSNVNRPFSFDYAVISSTQNSSTVIPVAKSDDTPSSHATTPIGAIVGAAVGGVLALALIVIGFLLMRRRRRRRAERSFKLDLIDEEPKPYILPNHSEIHHESYEQDLSDASRPLPAVPAGAGLHIAPSKYQQQMDYYPQSEYTSEEVLLSPQEQSQASGSSSYGPTVFTGTVSTGTVSTGTVLTADGRGTARSRSRSTSHRDTKSRSPRSQADTGELSEAPAVQEEDAGVVLPPEDEPVARTLPPAYNPEWHAREG